MTDFVRALGAVIAAAFVIGFATPGFSATIVDTGAPPANWGGEGFDAGSAFAGRFSVGTGYTITSIESFLVSGAEDDPPAGVDSTLTIRISEDGGSIPGATLYSTQFNMGEGPHPPAWQGAFGLDWAIGAGTYWVTFALTGSDYFSGSIVQGAPNPLQEAIYLPFDGGAWSAGGNDYAFRIEGTAVPEPATWAMMIAGFALVGAALRRRKAALAFA